MSAARTMLSELLAPFADDSSLALAVHLRAHVLEPALQAALFAGRIAVLLAGNPGHTVDTHASSSDA